MTLDLETIFVVDKSKAGKWIGTYLQSPSDSVVDISFESRSFIALRFFPPSEVTICLIFFSWMALSIMPTLCDIEWLFVT